MLQNIENQWSKKLDVAERTEWLRKNVFKKDVENSLCRVKTRKGESPSGGAALLLKFV